MQNVRVNHNLESSLEISPAEFSITCWADQRASHSRLVASRSTAGEIVGRAAFWKL